MLRWHEAVGREKMSEQWTSFIARHLKNPETAGVRQVQYKESELSNLLIRSREVLLKQPMLLEINAPIVVVGDIHGQFQDLLHIFDKGGRPHATSYLFLGDYVDRGQQSLECIALLLAYKVQYPNNFFLLRGNHECAHINRVYGFYDELKRRNFSPRLWLSFQDIFRVLPLAALISKRILCMHGGLSPDLTDFDAIRKIRRPIEVVEGGIAMDLLWADPDLTTQNWAQSNRGVSWMFGTSVVQEASKVLDIDMVARAHQVVQEGYQFFARKRLVTIFSAPNYCNEFDNKAAIMFVSKDLQCKFRCFSATGINPKIVLKKTSSYVPLKDVLRYAQK